MIVRPSFRELKTATEITQNAFLARGLRPMAAMVELRHTVIPIPPPLQVGERAWWSKVRGKVAIIELVR